MLAPLAVTALAVLLVALAGPALGGPAASRGPRAAASPASPPRPAAPAAPDPADGEVYRWVDEAGTVNLTQGLGNVPERFRAGARPMGWVSDPAAAPAPSRPAPDVRTRAEVDGDFRKARTAFDFLIVARRYRSRGWDREAREAVDRAAARAWDSGEWNAVAASYDSLGMARAADEARRKAQLAPARP